MIREFARGRVIPRRGIRSREGRATCSSARGRGSKSSSARGITAAEENQRLNLQTRMQRSSPERTVGPTADKADGEGWNSSGLQDVTAGGCADSATPCRPPSGRVGGPGGDGLRPWHEQTPVVWQRHCGDEHDALPEQDPSPRCRPTQQLFTARQQEAGLPPVFSASLLAAQRHIVRGKDWSGSRAAASQTRLADANCRETHIVFVHSVTNDYRLS